MQPRARTFVPFLATSILAASPAFAQGTPPAVHVTSMSGGLSVTGPAQHVPAVGELLAPGTRLVTASDGHAVLTIEGRGVVDVEPNTTLVVEGSASSHPSRPVSTNSSLVRGIVTVQISQGGSPLTLSLPQGDAVLQAGETMLRAESARTTRIAVHTGRARVRAGGREVPLTDGMATSLMAGHAATTPHPIATAPVWTSPPSGRLGTGGPVDVSGTFSAPTAGMPAQYRFVVTRESAGGAPVIDRMVPAPATRFDATGLAAGSYVARVTAVDADGIEGAPSEPARFVVAAPRMVPSGHGQRARVEIPTGFFCALDRGPMIAMHGAMQLSPGRAHTLRCASRADGSDGVDIPITAEQSGQLEPIVRLDPPGFDASGGMRVLQLQFHDAAGTVVIPTTVAVTGSAGVHVGTVHPSHIPGTYTATISWGAGLSEVRLHIVLDGANTIEYRLAPDTGAGQVVSVNSH